MVSHYECGGGGGSGGCDAGGGGGGCGAGGGGCGASDGSGCCGAGGGGGGSGGCGAGGLIGFARLLTSENVLQVPVLQPARGLSSGFDVAAKSEESLNK